MIGAALFLLALLLAPAGSAFGQQQADYYATPKVDAALISEVVSASPGETVRIGLQQKIAPGWHTYWKNPGDSGQATTVDLTLPEGARAGEIVWPAPHRLPYADLVNYGYKDEVLLPLAVSLPVDWPAGKPFEIAAYAEWLVCEEICIPEFGEFTLTLPTAAGGSAKHPGTAELFRKADAETPVKSPWPARAGLADGVLGLELEGHIAQASVIDAYFFPDTWGLIDHAAPQAFALGADGLVLEAQAGDVAPGAHLGGVLTIAERVGGEVVARSISIDAPVTLGSLPGGNAGGIGLVEAMFFAFLGGIILNLMPCVFPVLSLKALGLVARAHGGRRDVLTHGFTYAGGILAAFAVLAIAIVAFRSFGAELGWGFQLQSPVIVGLLAYLMFGLGLNLAGVFEFGARLMGVGEAATRREGHGGAFATGVLAVVVATPCTAPFMGGALGYALFQPAPVVLAVLLCLGLGLASPYLALCAVPRLGRLLPRPGPWMVRLKQVLAFPMFATAAWLIWVLAQQVDARAMLAVLMGLVLIGFAAWLKGIGDRSVADGMRRVVGLSAAATLLVAVLLIPGLLVGAGSSAAARGSLDDPFSEPFTPARLAALREAGEPVFLNATAAWCFSCQVNDRVALSGERFGAALEADGVAYLKADWTNRDAAIAKLLREHGRSGVPLYLVFPRGAGGPEVLPQVLTESIVLDALARAG